MSTNIVVHEDRRLAVVSISHMTRRDSELLEQGNKPSGFYMKGEYGYQFNTFIDWQEDWEELGFSRELFDNLQALFALNYDRVEFDRDAPRVDNLPAFNW